MNTKQLGAMIKDLRKKVGLTQKELAAGICTQAQISNIENGELNISSIMLYNLCKKMGVEMNYFFDLSFIHKDERIVSVKDLIRKLIRKRDYHSIAYIINKEKESQEFKSIDDKQFLLWHEGICDYYIEGNAEQAISKLEKSIELTNSNQENYTEREIEVLNSIAIILTEKRRYEEALVIFKNAVHHLDILPSTEDENIKPRILYGMSKCLTDMKNFKDSLHYSKLGKQICIDNQTLYLLGEFLYQIGRNYISLSNKKMGIDYLHQAISLFKIQDNYKFADIIISELEEMEIMY
ncbi:helix-turn-helix domain-containing protein [Rossellomorea vietnamensis]|uniref:helix-turn-helix domain-containing protein n=1 Tax=Rossellomorea vietnamensis TaxID=218284 RepID=UPI001E43B771|nr:helix-turn-helix domain-containing protein [Rossellomorea vietnamensis]MCC5804663.1 helix-turn-helix transcriptional regulator [Rossellomorea vietnamensis]